MQARVGLLVADVIPIYMIMPRYSHNYALFYQLLDSNLFTHRNTLLSLEKTLVKPMAPWSILIISIYITLFTCFVFYFAFTLYFASIYQKYQNIYIILLSLSDLTFASGREGIDNPFIALVARFLFVCVGTRDLCRAS